jgi:hypothetical protein
MRDILNYIFLAESDILFWAKKHKRDPGFLVFDFIVDESKQLKLNYTADEWKELKPLLSYKANLMQVSGNYEELEHANILRAELLIEEKFRDGENSIRMEEELWIEEIKPWIKKIYEGLIETVNASDEQILKPEADRDKNIMILTEEQRQYNIDRSDFIQKNFKILTPQS